MYRAIESVLSRMGITNMYARVAVPKIENEYLTRNSLQFHEYMGFTKVGFWKKRIQISSMVRPGDNGKIHRTPQRQSRRGKIFR